ncbi:Inner membrane protein YohD [anaerobic digester metagenome]
MILPSMAELLATYGYAVLLLGTFLEGETVLVAAGFLAHRGYMNLWLVVLCAYLGSLAGDQLFFFLGRRHGQQWLVRHEGWRAGIERVDRLMSRYGWVVLLGFRFAYGLRSVTPFALGLSGLSAMKFAVFNLVGALIWAVVVGGAGYLFGSTLELFMDRLARYEHLMAAGILAAGVVIWAGRCWLNRRRKA